MSKNKQRKKDQKMRQSIEVLKAQLKVESKADRNPISTTPAIQSNKTVQDKMQMLDDKFVKRDLMKTIVLSTVSFAIIITLWALNITSF